MPSPTFGYRRKDRKNDPSGHGTEANGKMHAATPTTSPVSSSTGWIGKQLLQLLIPSEILAASMFAPGIISLAFYKRRPSRVQVILGLVATIVLSALLGYISPSGPLSQLGSVILAVVGGVILYVAISALLLYWYQPRHARPPLPTAPTPAP